MKTFINDDFMLKGEVAKELYHNYAKTMSICDYHCHLEAKDIYENKVFEDVSKIWFEDDHYKWRLLRSNGFDEKYITGSATGKEKFFFWSQTIEDAIGNPIYHWTHMELSKYFGVKETLSSNNWEEIWDSCNDTIAGNDLSPRKLIELSGVTHLCTTNSPIDDLIYHKLLNEDQTFTTKVYPTFRSDIFFHLNCSAFDSHIQILEGITGSNISDIHALIEALENRIIYFNKNGCKLSDHGLDCIDYVKHTHEEAEMTFLKHMSGHKVTINEAKVFKSYMQYQLGKLYLKYNWVMQLHIGALRDVNLKKGRGYWAV